MKASLALKQGDILRSRFCLSCPWHIRIGSHTTVFKMEGKTISNQDETPERLCSMDLGARWPGLESWFHTCWCWKTLCIGFCIWIVWRMIIVPLTRLCREKSIWAVPAHSRYPAGVAGPGEAVWCSGREHNPAPPWPSLGSYLTSVCLSFSSMKWGCARDYYKD